MDQLLEVALAAEQEQIHQVRYTLLLRKVHPRYSRHTRRHNLLRVVRRNLQRVVRLYILRTINTSVSHIPDDR